MGNSQFATSASLVYRVRYNDSSLTELGLTTALPDPELLFIIQALPRNHTIRSVVLFDAFTSHVIQQIQWYPFVNALSNVSSLQQVELLETSVPLDSLRYLIQNPTLQTLAVVDGIELGSITPQGIAILGNVLSEQPASRLQEFVWECKFSNSASLLDTLLFGLSKCSQLKLLGLVNSNVSSATVALCSPESLRDFCLQRRSTLHTLDLSGCGLADPHFRMIQQGLINEEEFPCAIARLQVPRNLATKDGLECILQLVQSNTQLQILKTDATGTLHERLQLWLSWNIHVDALLGGRVPSRVVLGYMMVRVKDQPDFLFLLLVKYPDIFL